MSEWLTVEQAAAEIGLSARSVYALCAARKLAHYRLGAGRNAIRLTREAVADYLAAGFVAANDEPVIRRPAPKAEPARPRALTRHLRPPP